MNRTIIMVIFLLSSMLPSAASTAAGRIQLHFDASEAESVLAIIAKQASEQAITGADWQRVFATEPYQRLKKREASMHRDFTDDEFKKFVLSDETVKRGAELRRTLDEWKQADLNAAAQHVLAYLPAESVIRAKVFPVIKPQNNSFVFETTTDPAIFLYLDPAQGRQRFEITVSHELHHVGLSSDSEAYDKALASLAPGPRHAAEWMGAFGEGLAMLAAAGGPDVDPVATYPPELQSEWKRELQNFGSDLNRVQAFFLDVAAGRVTSESEIQERGFTFFGRIGPWYSVGYKMAVVVEKRYGRASLVECMLDFRKLLASYNQAAAELNRDHGEHLPLWSSELLNLVKAAPVGQPRAGGNAGLDPPQDARGL